MVWNLREFSHSSANRFIAPTLGERVTAFPTHTPEYVSWTAAKDFNILHWTLWRCIRENAKFHKNHESDEAKSPSWLMVKIIVKSVKYWQILELLFHWSYMENPENMKSLFVHIWRNNWSVHVNAKSSKMCVIFFEKNICKGCNLSLPLCVKNKTLQMSLRG